MSEASSSTQGPNDSAGPERAERLRLTLVTGAILLALALIVVVLRLQRLDELPPGLNRDEGIDGALALQVLEGEHAIFFPVDQGREPSAIYALALSTILFGRTLLAMHLPTALGSAGLVFAVFWLGRLLFGRDDGGRATPWRGLLIGGVGAGLMAVSVSQTIIGRTSYNKVTHMPLLLALCMALLWWGWSKAEQRPSSGDAPPGAASAGDGAGAGRQRSWWRIVLAGVCAGLLPYTYIPARFTPFLFLLFGLSFLLPWEGDEDREEGSGRRSRSSHFSLRVSRLRAELPWAGIFVGVTGLVAAPILVHFALHPEHFLMRSREVWLLRGDQGNAFGAFLGNVWEYMLVFGIRGDPNWRHNFAGQSMLKPWEAIFFWLAVGIAVWRWKRPAYRLLLLWLGVLLLPAMLSRDDIVPHFLRMMGATPAVYLLTAAGLWEALRFLWERRNAIQWPAMQVFGQKENRVAIALGIAVSGLILVQGVFTYRTYFQTWATLPEVYEANETEWAELARTLNARPPEPDAVYLVPYTISEHYSFEYLYGDTVPADVISASVPYLPKELETALAAKENPATVKFVDWDNDRVSGDTLAEQHAVVLLGKYGRYEGAEAYDSFQIHTFTGIDLDRPWAFYEDLEPRAVHYDGGISLIGLASGQGEEQLSTEEPLSLGAERALWVALRWQTAPGLEIDYSISVRVHDAEGGRVYQKDAVLLDARHWRTGRWTEEEPVDTVFYLDIPADLPRGDYELRLIVYDAATLSPTVELGVWEPEVVLARLRLVEGG